MRRHYTKNQRTVLAAKYDHYADELLHEASQLEAAGQQDSAAIHRRGAQANRDVADAARESSRRLNEILNS
ncbi:hypothetical protein [Streptomyces lydicus]|uniref:hypothetical protein n=1 Tax=Streptomyces lydicus TaxID=47763 RepID=UPI0036E1BEC8